MKYAYSQLKLTAETAKQCNFNIIGGQATGTYRFLTGFYGLADKLAEFQKSMDRTLNHAENTFCFLDDILIVSKESEQEHEKLIMNVLEKLEKENSALKLSKCELFQQEVNWLVHKLSLEGISPKIIKTEAILKLSPPISLKQLRSFLGSINHLAKFIQNAATLTEKLRPLLREENEKKLKSVKIQLKKFEWKEEHSEIFESIKAAVANITKIHYYDPKLLTRVKCDASHSGMGASLEQQNWEGEWIPIAFASRYLNTQEKKYSTNELELLAVVWSVDRLKHCLLGKEFVIATDHKALVSALDEHKSNKTYQSRLTRWVDRLLPYQFKVIHLPGKDMGIEDYLSRNPKSEPRPESVLDEKFVVTSIESFHKALDCLNSRLSDDDRLDRNENVLEYSRIDQNVSNQNTSSTPRCYGNQNGPKRTKHDRNERNEVSRSFQREKFENSKISLSQNCQQIQSVESVKEIGKLSNHESENIHSGETAKRGKERKMFRIQDRNNTDTLRGEITETTFQRTGMIQGPQTNQNQRIRTLNKYHKRLGTR